jgi:hypothetical protein
MFHLSRRIGLEGEGHFRDRRFPERFHGSIQNRDAQYGADGALSRGEHAAEKFSFGDILRFQLHAAVGVERMDRGAGIIRRR